MTSPFGPDRRRRRPLRTAGGCLLGVLALFLFISAMELFWTRVDERRFPWAYARLGRPALTGTWVGTLTTGGGARRGVYLDLRIEPIRTGRRGSGNLYRLARPSKLEGEVRLCGGPAGEQRFTFTGNNEDDAATRIHLLLYPADSTPPDRLAPSHLRGRWNGRDSLAVEVDMFLLRGTSAVTGTSDRHTGRPATLGMRRGGEAEFRALCASTGGARAGSVVARTAHSGARLAIGQA